MKKIRLPQSRTTPRRIASRQTPLRRSIARSPALRRILVPLDFSGKSRQALDTAIPLAESHGGKISLIHVVESVYVSGDMGLPYPPVDNADAIDKARVRLRETSEQIVPRGLRGQLIVREGSAHHQITKAATSWGADLIVIASRGNTGLGRMLLGSTAERVVRHAPCAVLVVRRSG